MGIINQFLFIIFLEIFSVIARGHMANYVDRVVIPSVSIDITLFQGDERIALSRGAWLIARTGDPVMGGNMVVAAHRYRTGIPKQNTFYTLPQVRIGDVINLYWHGSLYKYSVVAVTIVGPDDYRYEERTDDQQLTLVTCTPLQTSAKRLIVTAKRREY